ncbi:HAD family hydrolase [Nakamurella flava]|uniref:HAD family hydrolase n=1 Tax=Nakamurella flava TaxID=2576308 RepID=A0A4U6QAH3_9ACTN|nr:HAD hydrolase-like protein [Nakamurella flava]TKV56909.1 HAD family hydrolase [Nakamurella flava]
MADIAIFDVDGTLVDSNYQHALAWYRAFRRYDITLPLWRIHRALGMGGDQLVGAVAGDRVEEEHGDDLRDAWLEEFDPLLPEVAPIEGARDLLVEVKRRGFRLVLASSGEERIVKAFLELFDGEALADAWTTSADAEHSKPATDLVETAVQKVGGGSGVIVGDATWDCIAAGKLGFPTITVQTGGFSPDELRESGAIKVYDSLVELRENLDDTPLRAAD